MSEYITVKDGTRISYDVHGEGSPILLIHGVTDCKETYDTDLPFLTKNHRVYRYDLRGHGASDHPKHPFTLENHIEDALAVISKLNLHNFVLYGGSLGSYIAEAVATKIPQDLSGLILNVSAAHNPASALADTAKNDNIPLDKVERRDYWIRHLTIDKGNIKQLTDSGFQKNSLSPEDEDRALRSITAFDFRNELPKITCPTLITSGLYDPVNGPSKGIEIQKYIPNACFVVFKSGHLQRLEMPTVYHHVVDDFIETVAR
ncbi:alpha/beta hydrolase [Lacticaseibacillus paracasei]|uniref:alpha/beta fold hydrolase n=1 Tax=Lacticaseibacillus paracasei TaxID=1597 RepID=UPI0023493BBF|nr:alpha/beta hydrolase [Lacticaseibacillus paracasei]MDC6273378.1 alpha/beta hydrolase [Lacticaseibacillus paracasei]MDN4554530.1 alpha/beta hydrolase [Lacticaseibacillus paracasei]